MMGCFVELESDDASYLLLRLWHDDEELEWSSASGRCEIKPKKLFCIIITTVHIQSSCYVLLYLVF
jgi:hypothetical protein